MARSPSHCNSAPLGRPRPIQLRRDPTSSGKKKPRETSENPPPPRYPSVTQVASLADRSEKIARSPGGASDHLSPGTVRAAVSDSEEVPRIPSAARRTTCPRVPHAPPSPSRTLATIGPSTRRRARHEPLPQTPPRGAAPTRRNRRFSPAFGATELPGDAAGTRRLRCRCRPGSRR